MKKKLKSICSEFGINYELESYELLSTGHINTTYKVNFLKEGKIKSYVLQKLNTYVFKNPEEVMDNIFSVTNHIKDKLTVSNIDYKNYVLDFKTYNGKPYMYDENNNFWRCYDYIDNSTIYNKTNNLKIIEETGKAFGEFQLYLKDYPVEKLNIVIPHFHNTVNRYQLFKEAIRNDFSNRRNSISDLINQYLDLEEIATTMYKLQKQGKLPLKVTHNDTKCNNVLFDKTTNNHLAVIDLDTVMPGLVGFDFGDAIRFIANTSDEDEKNLNKVTFDVDKYNAFYKGFFGTVKHTLSPLEIDTLPLGALTMTIECGLRFLTDYLDGDKYFKVDYPEHNLDRSKCQLKLALEIRYHLKNELAKFLND